MSIKHQIKSLAEQVTGTRIYRALPRGVDIASDVARYLPAVKVDTVLDVGANVGQSARDFLAWFPQARIYCFEPVRGTFRQLQESVHGEARVHPLQIALGAEPCHARMVLEGPSEMFHLAQPGPDEAATDSSGAFEDVELQTLDRFCADAGLEHVSYLKIDTEGADLDVLRGAAGMLAGQRIDIVQVEAGMNRRNLRHVPLEVLKDHMESRDYFLFGLYEQMHEWPAEEPQLRRVNALFISDAVIRAHRGGAGAPPPHAA